MPRCRVIPIVQKNRKKKPRLVQIEKRIPSFPHRLTADEEKMFRELHEKESD